MPRGIYQHKSPSKETIEKRVIALKGQRRSSEIKQKMSEAQRKCGNIPPSARGRKWSDESRRRWAEKQRGEGAVWYGRRHSSETRLKLSKMNRGEKSPNWQGGITAPTENLRHTVEYRLWREAIFARDDYTCRECERRGRRLHPHHIKSFAKYPELRFEVDNGETLCEECHLKTKNFGGKGLVDRHFRLGPGKEQGDLDNVGGVI